VRKRLEGIIVTCLDVLELHTRKTNNGGIRCHTKNEGFSLDSLSVATALRKRLRLCALYYFENLVESNGSVADFSLLLFGFRRTYERTPRVTVYPSHSSRVQQLPPKPPSVELQQGYYGYSYVDSSKSRLLFTGALVFVESTLSFGICRCRVCSHRTRSSIPLFSIRCTGDWYSTSAISL
jgi:hypothetical protein